MRVLLQMYLAACSASGRLSWHGAFPSCCCGLGVHVLVASWLRALRLFHPAVVLARRLNMVHWRWAATWPL